MLMPKNLLPKIVLISFFLLSLIRAHAVELGSMTIFSMPGENFQAEIEVLDIQGIDQNDVQVSIPDKSTFQQVGLTYQAYLDDMNLLFLTISNRKAIIKISSIFPVKDKRIVLLINLKWPGGSLTREYVTELTGSGFVNNANSPVQLPGSKKISDPVPSERTTGRTTDRAQSAQKDMDTNNRNRTYADNQPDKVLKITRINALSVPDQITIDIVSGDTLQNIAETIKLAYFRQDATVNTEQIMLSILENQPEAFQQNNKSAFAFKPGISIKSPQHKEVSQYDADTARNTVDKLKAAAKAQQRKQNTAKNKTGARTATDQVKLSTGSPEKSDSAEKPAKTASVRTADQTREQQRAANLEELDRLKRQTDELKFRLQNLEQQLADAKQLMMLKNQQLEQMQASLQEAEREAERIKQQSFLSYFHHPLFWIFLAIGLFLLVIILRVLMAPGGYMLHKRRKSYSQEAEEGQGDDDYDAAIDTDSYNARAVYAANSRNPDAEEHDRVEDNHIEDYATDKQYSDHDATAAASVTKQEHAEENHLADDRVDDRLVAAPVAAESHAIADQEQTIRTELDAKLDLAKAYIGMHALAEAEALINDVLEQGSAQQVAQAEKLLDDMGQA